LLIGTIPPSRAAKKLELFKHKKITGAVGERLLNISFKSGISLSTLSLVSFQPPEADL
jgi:hypothetical protein